MQQRDELCRRGEVLLSPALNFTRDQLSDAVDENRRDQASKEQRDEDERRKTVAAVKAGSSQVGAVLFVFN